MIRRPEFTPYPQMGQRE
jgi:hypothetical protein